MTEGDCVTTYGLLFLGVVFTGVCLVLGIIFWPSEYFKWKKKQKEMQETERLRSLLGMSDLGGRIIQRRDLDDSLEFSSMSLDAKLKALEERITKIKKK